MYVQIKSSGSRMTPLDKSKDRPCTSLWMKYNFTLMVAKVMLFEYAIVNLWMKYKLLSIDTEFIYLTPSICEDNNYRTINGLMYNISPCGLTMEVPSPPVINNRKVE
jgi:hypothetical protein